MVEPKGREEIDEEAFAEKLPRFLADVFHEFLLCLPQFYQVNSSIPFKSFLSQKVFLSLFQDRICLP